LIVSHNLGVDVTFAQASLNNIEYKKVDDVKHQMIVAFKFALVALNRYY
jgi:hypothetical protein